MGRRELLLSVLVLCACDGADRPLAQPPALAGSDQASFVAAGELRAKAVALRLGLTTGVVSAQQVQERIGDGILGPSDVVTYTVLQVREGGLLAWSPKASRLAARPTYVAPKAMSQWVDRADFETLEFYDGSPLTPQSGWIGIARGAGRVYVVASTM